jgi:two-component system sensor histidine kinase DesK
MNRLRSFRLLPEQAGPYAWIWMINFAIPLFYLVTQPFHRTWIGYAAVLVLAVSYRQSLWSVERPRLYLFIFLQIAAVGVLAGLYASPFLYMEFFPAVSIGMLQSGRSILLCGGFMTLTSIVVLAYHYFDNGDDFWISFLPSMLIVLFFPFTIRAQRRSRHLKQQLATANEEIERLIKNNERQRIARDLHDTIGHTLTLITLKSELLERMIPRNPELAISEAQDIRRTTRTALKQLRELVSDMQAVNIGEELAHAERMMQSAGIRFTVRGGEAVDSAPPIVRNILGLCLRECLTNVAKHSRAALCEVELAERPGAYELQVRDDGVGIAAPDSNAGRSGSGLLGMRERLALLDGKLELESGAAGGTLIRITVPKVLRQQGGEART